VIQKYRCEKLDSAGTREVTQTRDGWIAVTKGTIRGKSDEQRLTMRRIGDCR
jgi:hypothetical protein